MTKKYESMFRGLSWIFMKNTHHSILTFDICWVPICNFVNHKNRHLQVLILTYIYGIYIYIYIYIRNNFGNVNYLFLWDTNIHICFVIHQTLIQTMFINCWWYKCWYVRKLPRSTTNVQKNKSYVGLFISYVGLKKSSVGLYNSYVGDKIS